MSAKQDNLETGQPARRSAARILGAVLVERQFLDAAVAAHCTELGGPDRARAQTMASGVLRQLSALDAMIDPLLKRETPVRVRHVLRIAAWEICVDGVPAHAAVDGAVKSVKSTRKIEHLAGLTNAVARRFEAMELDPTPGRMPAYLRKPLTAAFNGKIVSDIEAVQAAEPPVDLTLKDLAARDAWAERLNASPLPGGSLRLARAGQVSALPGYDDGEWWVQDVAAALPVRLLGDVAGARVADLCAAPGGKTMQLAAGGADVTSIDNSKARLERVAENLARIKLTARIVCADAETYADDLFDIVVLDAPCSATGTLRRHPDLPYVKKDLSLGPILALQTRLVAAAAKLVKPGGRLLYCTCSMLPSEGGAQVHGLVTEGWENVSALPDDCPDHWMNARGQLQTRPDYLADRGGMDGFFAIVLQKPV